VLNDTTDFVVDARWNRDVSLRPWLVQNGQDFYRWKEVFAEVSSLKVIPSECLIFQAHKLVHELLLFR
jgi:hypothetical protein